MPTIVATMPTSDFNLLRRMTGLSQQDLAGLVGVSAPTVNRWCSEGRADHCPPPRYAIAAMLLYREMTQVQRERALMEIALLRWDE